MAVPDRADAVIVVSFGGPEGPDDVLPFLRNVTAGRDIPDERLAEVGEHYAHFGGVSPLNAQNRALVEALAERIDLPVHLGNRNWHPFLTDTVAELRDAGVRRAIAFVTSAYGGYSGRTQYLEDIAAARAAAGARAPEIDVLPPFFDRPGFTEPLADALRAARSEHPDAAVVFTAHSVPTSQPGVDRYVADLRTACRLVAGAEEGWELVYQSRSGPPQMPWLEPDVNDWLRSRAEGIETALVMPIGFLSDHVEVLWDLDVELAATADEVGVELVRLPTVGTDPRFVAMLADMVAEATGA